MAKTYRQRIDKKGEANRLLRERDNLVHQIEAPLLVRISELELELKRARKDADQLRRECHAIAVFAGTIAGRAAALASGKSEIT